MIDKLFDHHFSSFFQGYSLWHKKNQPWPWRWNKKYEDFFSKLFNKNFNKCPAPRKHNIKRLKRKHKIKRLKGLSHRQLIMKGTFRQGQKTSKFVIVIIEKWFDHHFSSFFQGYTITQIIFRFGARIKVPPS